MGITIDLRLSWDTHIDRICSKANSLLGFVYRNFYSCASSTTLRRLYITYVRPHLEYAVSGWDPHLTKHITRIEKIQKFACRIALHSWSQDYSSMLTSLSLQSLQTRRLYLKLTLFYNLYHNYSYFPPPLPITISQSNYNFRYNSFLIPLYYHSVLYNSFFPSMARFLNNNHALYQNFIDCNLSTHIFKSCIMSCIMSSQDKCI